MAKEQHYIDFDEYIRQGEPDKLPDKFDTDNDYIKKLIKVVGNNKMSIREILDAICLKTERVSWMSTLIPLFPKVSSACIIPTSRAIHGRNTC